MYPNDGSMMDGGMYPNDGSMMDGGMYPNDGNMMVGGMYPNDGSMMDCLYPHEHNMMHDESYSDNEMGIETPTIDIMPIDGLIM